MLRPIARELRRRAPSFYSRARNGVSLLHWCATSGLGIGTPEAGAYDEAFWALHAGGDWEGFAALIVERFAPQTVADVGCGDGKLLVALARVSPGITASGYDGSPPAVAAAQARGADAAHVDLAFSRLRAAEPLAARLRGCDLAISLETAEHLPPWSARPLVHVLTQAPVVVFSAAQPMQGGTRHMNERPARYWVARFAAAGFDLHPGDDAFRDDVGRLDLPWWYARNIRVFRRRPA